MILRKLRKLRKLTSADRVGADKRRGQALLELVIVIGILVLILTALVSLLVLSLSTVQKSRLRSRAVAIAEGGVENIRQSRDSYIDDWDGFKANCCSNINSCAGSGFGGIVDAIYRPTAACTDNGDSVLVVTSVDWAFGGKSDYEVVLRTEFGRRSEVIFR